MSDWLQLSNDRLVNLATGASLDLVRDSTDGPQRIQLTTTELVQDLTNPWSAQHAVELNFINLARDLQAVRFTYNDKGEWVGGDAS